MHRAFASTAMLALFHATPAMAQETRQGAESFNIGTDLLLRPGSPSNGTSTVSPSSVPDNMDRLDPDARSLSVSLGTLYASGDFGAATDTSIWSSALSVRYRIGDLRLSASLPWMRITSDAVIFTGIDSTPVLVAPASQAGRRTAQGLADLTLGAAYTIVPGQGGFDVELSGRVKLDTATRSSGLSSGEKDYAAGVQITRPIGRLAPFVSTTYRVLGDTPAFRLRDGFAASAGSSFMLGRGSYLLASYHYSERATDLVDDAHELFIGAATPVPDTSLRVTGFATAGLSDGAAARSIGIALSGAF